jgi:hypothetical protein
VPDEPEVGFDLLSYSINDETIHMIVPHELFDIIARRYVGYTK